MCGRQKKGGVGKLQVAGGRCGGGAKRQVCAGGGGRAEARQSHGKGCVEGEKEATMAGYKAKCGRGGRQSGGVARV